MKPSGRYGGVRDRAGTDALGFLAPVPPHESRPREATHMKRWMLGAALVGALVVFAPAPAAWSQANLGLPQAPPEQVGMSKQKLDRVHDALKQDVGERLFKPLKMQDTAFWVPSPKMGRVAQPL